MFWQKVLIAVHLKRVWDPEGLSPDLIPFAELNWGEKGN